MTLNEQDTTSPSLESYRTITLPHGHVAFVDESNYEHLRLFDWYPLKIESTVYAVRNVRLDTGKMQLVYMHRQICGFPAGNVDHRDRDGLHNWEQNLRTATKSQNAANSKLNSRNKVGLKGVSYDKQTRRWRASISIDGRSINLGRYATPQLAHEAYVRAAVRYFGEFARAA